MKVNLRPLSLPGVGLIAGTRISDGRGYFAECYVRADFVAAGLTNDFIQDNQSCSTASGTVRGLHFQSPPFAQAKLVRVLKGRVLDVVVDLRRSLPTYGRHLAVEISEESGEQLYVPAGFAHGFCTLEPDTVVLYKVDSVYSPNHDRGINWADPDLGIAWPVRESDAVMSDKDRALPRLRDLPSYFD
jgi:dTDP-4-dehydrorhamnose 3,5-epimerase